MKGFGQKFISGNHFASAVLPCSEAQERNVGWRKMLILGDQILTSTYCDQTAFHLWVID